MDFLHKWQPFLGVCLTAEYPASACAGTSRVKQDWTQKKEKRFIHLPFNIFTATTEIVLPRFINPSATSPLAPSPIIRCMSIFSLGHSNSLCAKEPQVLLCGHASSVYEFQSSFSPVDTRIRKLYQSALSFVLFFPLLCCLIFLFVYLPFNHCCA